VAVSGRWDHRERAIEEAKKRGRQEFDESDLEAGVGPAYIRKRPKTKQEDEV